MKLDLVQLHQLVQYPVPANLEYRGSYVYNWFSNFNRMPLPIFDQFGIQYFYHECAFQAAKTLDIGARREIAAAGQGPAKRLGRKLQLRADWEQAKCGVMYGIQQQRAVVDLAFRTRLLATPTTIIEWNNWGDAEWGVPVQTGLGKNLLGKLLMKLQVQLEEERSIGVEL